MSNNEFEVTELFNELYIRIVEKNCGSKTLKVLERPENSKQAHPSTKEIRKYYSSKQHSEMFSFPEAFREEIIH